MPEVFSVNPRNITFETLPEFTNAPKLAVGARIADREPSIVRLLLTEIGDEKV
jgi:hypothetical protein